MFQIFKPLILALEQAHDVRLVQNCGHEKGAHACGGESLEEEKCPDEDLAKDWDSENPDAIM